MTHFHHVLDRYDDNGMPERIPITVDVEYEPGEIGSRHEPSIPSGYHILKVRKSETGEPIVVTPRERDMIEAELREVERALYL